MKHAVVRWSDISGTKRLDARFHVELARNKTAVERLKSKKTREELIEFAGKVAMFCKEAWETVRRSMGPDPESPAGNFMPDKWRNYTDTDIALYCVVAATYHRESLGQKKQQHQDALVKLAEQDEAFRMFLEAT